MRLSLLQMLSKSFMMLTVTVTMTVALSACGQAPEPKADEAAAAEPPSSTYTVEVSKEEADAITSSADLSCAMTGGLCPSALAMSIARVDRSNTSKLYQCSAFLVGRDIVATNTHCLPDDLRVRGANCANRVTFYFGKSAIDDAEIASCAQVISATDITKDQKGPGTGSAPDLLRSDIAFLKLTRPLKRKPFSVTREGASDDLALTVYAVDPKLSPHRMRGIGRAKTCVTKQNSLLAPQYTNDFANVIAAKCSVIPGNSGSPAVDSRGNVRAILHGYRPLSSIHPETYSGYRMPDHFDEMALLTNMSCAQTPNALELGATALVCNAPIPTRQDVVRMFEHSKSVDVDLPFQNWKLNGPRIFGFELAYIGSEAGRASTPRLKCLVAPDQWISRAAEDLKLESYAVAGDQMLITFILPIWGAIPVLDSSERLRIVSGELDRARTTMTFDLSPMRKRKFARTSVTFKSETGVLLTRSAQIDLPICD